MGCGGPPQTTGPRSAATASPTARRTVGSLFHACGTRNWTCAPLCLCRARPFARSGDGARDGFAHQHVSLGFTLPGPCGCNHRKHFELWPIAGWLAAWYCFQHDDSDEDRSDAALGLLLTRRRPRVQRMDDVLARSWVLLGVICVQHFVFAIRDSYTQFRVLCKLLSSGYRLHGLGGVVRHSLAYGGNHERGCRHRSDDAYHGRGR